MSGTSFQISGGGVVVQVTVVEVTGDDGFTDLKFTYEVISNKIADIRGVFFHVNESLIDVNDLSVVSGDDVTGAQFALNAVTNLGNGSNMEGVDEGPFDVGIEIGTAGASPDDIQMTMFTLSLDGADLTLDVLSGEFFGIRLNSVGAPNSPRDGSLKLVDEMPLLPVGAQPITLTVEEEDAGLGLGGNEDTTPGADEDTAGDFDNTTDMAQGTLTFTSGGLPLNSFVFSDTSALTTETDGNAGQDLFWVRVSDIQIIGYLDGAMTMAAVQIDLIAPASIPAEQEGDVTVKVTLLDNLLHVDPGTNVEEVLNLGLVKVLASDGFNTVEGVVNIQEIDDIPVADLNDAGGAIVVDETDGADVPPETDPIGGNLGSVTVAAAALFTNNSSFGADGPASSDATVYSLVLNGVNTSLVDTLSGEGIDLVDNGGVIEGRTDTSNLLVFTLSIDAGTGAVTLTQERAVVHDDPNDPDEAGASAAFVGAGFIGLQVAVTDDDGDTVTDEIDIGDQVAFEDDGPTAGLTDGGAAIVVDETDGADVPPEVGPLGGNLGAVTVAAAALFTDTSVFGSDGPANAGATEYSLVLNGANTGLVDTLTMEGIELVDNGGVIEGRTDTSNLLVFTLSINGAGDVTLTQHRAVVHDDPPDPDEAGASAAFLGAGFVGLQVKVTDGDGDMDTAEIDIGDQVAFEDDGPGIGPIANGTVTFTDGSMVMNPLNFDPGSDGPADNPLMITAFTDLEDFVETLSPDGQTLTYSMDGTDFFQLELDALGDKYTFTVLEDAPLETFEVGGAFESGPPVETIKVAAADAGFITFDGTINGIDLDPDNLEPNNPLDDLNPDQLGFGVFQGQSSNINPFEGFIASFTAPDMETELAVAALKFKVDQTGNTDHVIIDWTAHLDGGSTVSGTGRIELQTGNNAEFVIIGISEVATPADSGSFVVSGEFTSIELVFRYDDGDPDAKESVRVEDFAIIDQILPDDEILEFTVKGTDGDGDMAEDSFQIGIDGDGGGVVFPAEALSLGDAELSDDGLDVFVADDGGALV